MRTRLLRTWRFYLFLSFFYFIYHLFRDILQDILGIHNVFTEVLHVELDPQRLPPYMTWMLFGGYRRWITFPIEIFMILVIPFVWKRKTFVVLDVVILALVLFWDVVWILAWLYQ